MQGFSSNRNYCALHWRMILGWWFHSLPRSPRSRNGLGIFWSTKRANWNIRHRIRFPNSWFCPWWRSGASSWSIFSKWTALDLDWLRFYLPLQSHHSQSSCSTRLASVLLLLSGLASLPWLVFLQYGCTEPWKFVQCSFLSSHFCFWSVQTPAAPPAVGTCTAAPWAHSAPTIYKAEVNQGSSAPAMEQDPDSKHSYLV